VPFNLFDHLYFHLSTTQVFPNYEVLPQLTPILSQELESDDYPFSTHDIMISSIESWDRYGMGEEDRSRDESFRAPFGPGNDYKEAFRSSGLFNLAVCIPKTSDDPKAGWDNPNSDDTPTPTGIETFLNHCMRAVRTVGIRSKS
jgi:hypothetical protein